MTDLSTFETEIASIPKHGWTDDQRVAIVEELKHILEDPNFKRSNRCTSLLSWLVERSLSDRCEGMKERTVGVAVFARSLDYDTNNDPIVRTAANEVRKRLAMYYQNPTCRRQVRIRLVPGSYVPHFDFHQAHSAETESAQAHDLDANPWEHLAPKADIPGPRSAPKEDAAPDAISAPIARTDFSSVEHDGVLPSPVQPDVGQEIPALQPVPFTVPRKDIPHAKNRMALWGGILLLLIAIGLVLAFSNHFRSAQYMVWDPLLHSSAVPIICLSEDDSYLLPNLSKLRDDGSAPNPSVTQTDKAPPHYSFTDLNIAHKVSLWLASHGKQVTLRQTHDLTLWDFHHQPVVLIGTADNLWPSILLSSLRFTPQFDPASGTLWIRDAQSPSKTTLAQSGPTRDNSTVDYAIVTRYLDEETGNWVLSIGGLGQHGTDAAGLLLTDPSFMVAVGTIIADRPLRRSVRARLRIRLL